MFSEHDGYLLVAFTTGEVEWGTALLCPGLHVGRAREEELGELSEPFLSCQGQRAFTAVGKWSDGIATVVQEKFNHINMVLAASLHMKIFKL